MDKGTRKNLKEELNGTFSDDYIRNAGLLIHGLAEKFYAEHDLIGKVYFNILSNYYNFDITIEI